MEHLQQQLDTIFPGSEKFTLHEATTRQVAPEVCWQRLRLKRGKDTPREEGLCLNLLTFPPEYLQPLPMRFHHQGRKRLMQDDTLQKAIANAFWQTCWAEGALRTTRGETHPVAFVTTDRLCPPGEDPEKPPVEKHGSLWLVGRENILFHRIREKAGLGQLFIENGKIVGELTAEEIAFLHEHAFVDRFIGDNATIKEKRPLRQIIRVNASHLISRLYAGELAFFALSPLPTTILAACNNGFFLNFPEEYRNPITAMNDPVGLLIVEGALLQAPLVPRAALLIDASGKAAVKIISMQHCELRLPWSSAAIAFGENGFAVDNSEQDGRQMVIYTPAWQAEHAPGAQKSPPGDTISLAVVFGRIAALQQGGGMDIPASGFVLSVPRHQLSMDEALDAVQGNGAAIGLRLRADLFAMQEIRTAIGAGPCLVQDGELISENFFEGGRAAEAFLPVRGDTRIMQAGIAPTRFPHDSDRTRAPRSIIGLTPEGKAVLCIIDGRLTNHSLGATLREAGRIGQALGCRQVLNLDGGGSSVLQLWPQAFRDTTLLPEISAGITNIPSDNGHRDRLMPIVITIAGP